jgi:hypothetical protein
MCNIVGPRPPFQTAGPPGSRKFTSFPSLYGTGLGTTIRVGRSSVQGILVKI